MRPAFSAGACVDLGAFDPGEPDCGAAAWLARASHVPSWVALMEDRQPDFFHGYRGYRADEMVGLNRHGPRSDAWRQQDLRRLVVALQTRGVRVLLGYWIHECRFVDERHPELLIRDQHGNLWQDEVERNADFNPMRRMRGDDEADVREGERYSTWSARQYAKIQRDFGFDGLFLGDGGMGFRRHGKDWKDLRHFDFHEEWLAEFRADAGFMEHEACTLDARDVHVYHWPHWVAWNTRRWTEYYREMAAAVHAAGGLLAAYNCMNYDPALARLHGVDYREIARAGLDILVFQAYDYAWGPLGPFGFLHIERKDLATNLRALLRTRAHVGYDTPMQIVVTVETVDEVETWNAPEAHTLGEAYAYGGAVAFDGDAWRRAADGALVVWGNDVPHSEWTALRAAFAHVSAPPAPPTGALVWDDAEAALLAARGAPTATEPHLLYAHMDVQRATGDGAADAAIMRLEHLAAAPFAAPARRTTPLPKTP